MSPFRIIAPRILVVEDEPDIREGIRQTLELEGFRVEEAVDGHDALRRLNDQPDINLILLDYNMPNMTGEQFIAAISPRDRDIPIIMVTASLVRLPGIPTMRKPFAIDRLYSMITRLLAAH